MGDIILLAFLLVVLIQQFKVILEVLIHYCSTLKLNNCTLLVPEQDSPVVDVIYEGNPSARIKEKVFSEIETLKTYLELWMIIFPWQKLRRELEMLR